MIFLINLSKIAAERNIKVARHEERGIEMLRQFTFSGFPVFNSVFTSFDSSSSYELLESSSELLLISDESLSSLSEACV